MPPTVLTAGGAPLDLTAMIGALGGSGGVQLHLRVEVTIPLVSKEAITVSINVLGGHGHGGSTVRVAASASPPAAINCSVRSPFLGTGSARAPIVRAPVYA